MANLSTFISHDVQCCFPRLLGMGISIASFHHNLLCHLAKPWLMTDNCDTVVQFLNKSSVLCVLESVTTETKHNKSLIRCDIHSRIFTHSEIMTFLSIKVVTCLRRKLLKIVFAINKRKISCFKDNTFFFFE